MRQRLALAGQDPDVLSGALPPLEAPPAPNEALARAKHLKAGLESQAQQRRN
jgi:hypothetical protein